MNRLPTNQPDIMLLAPDIHADSRGYFFEKYNQKEFDLLYGRPIRFVQDNQSKSVRGVLRGLHYQAGFSAQGKLVQVLLGKVLDVAVDLRVGSPTFGQWTAIELSDENKWQLFIPRGFAHGFSVLSKEAIFHYKCDNYWSLDQERGIAFNDPTLKIEWGIEEKEMILSEKDNHHPLLTEAKDLFDYKTDYYYEE